MLDLRKLFTEKELEEWKDTLVSWEAEGEIEDPENIPKWVGELTRAFEDELRGNTLDTETVIYWRKQLVPETRKAKKAYLKNEEKEQRDRERFVELRAQGLSYEKISKELSLSKATLLEWRAELGEELSKAQYLQLEAMAERYGAKKAARVELYGNTLQRLQKELEKRDLSDIPTEKLLGLSLKIQEKLSEELSGVRTVIAQRRFALDTDSREYAEIE